MPAEIIKDAEGKMKSSIDHLLHELGKLRTGQASVALLDDLMVDYYGNPTPLKQVATLGAPDSQTLTVQPWEVSIMKDIEKAIQASDLGLTPNNDGKVIRLTIPPLTKERRQQLVKLVKKQSEDSKVAIRNIRRDINEKLKQSEKKHDISEDEGRKGHDEVQKITDKFVAEVDKIVQTKEKDILEV
ncbi:MAG: ribosome recycling factor [Nitrospinae bacterium]|nr:ribosome recycling factor [Nitrospinota bacterium]